MIVFQNIGTYPAQWESFNKYDPIWKQPYMVKEQIQLEGTSAIKLTVLKDGTVGSNACCTIHKSLSPDLKEITVTFDVYIPSADIGSSTWAINFFKIWEGRFNKSNEYGGDGNLQICLSLNLNSLDKQFFHGFIIHEEFDADGNSKVVDQIDVWGTDQSVLGIFDRKVRITVYVKRHVSDGIIRWYLNGQLVGKYHGRTTYEDNGVVSHVAPHFNCYVGNDQTHHFWVAFSNMTVAMPGGCFIATACGVSNPVLGDLRSFRDRCLPDPLVHAYYRSSPPIADRLREHDRVKSTVRRVIECLSPLLP